MPLYTPSRINQLLQSILNQLKAQIKNKQLKLSTSFDKSLKSIITDENILSIALENIISNAVKYTPNQGKITIKTKKLKKSVRITIKDTGWGIPLGQQAKIFTRFFRAENIKKKDAQGVGLGLYFSRMLLRALRGKIWFRAQEKQGACFYVSIPLDPHF